MFAHVCPQKYIDSFEKNNERGVSWRQLGGDARAMGGEVLFNADKRVELMERLEDYTQVLVPIGEVLEPFMNPKDTYKLVQSYNNALSEWFDKYPKQVSWSGGERPLE